MATIAADSRRVVGTEADCAPRWRIAARRPGERSDHDTLARPSAGAPALLLTALPGAALAHPGHVAAPSFPLWVGYLITVSPAVGFLWFLLRERRRVGRA